MNQDQGGAIREWGKIAPIEPPTIVPCHQRRWFWSLGRDSGDGWVQYGIGIATIQWTETVGWLWWWNRD